MRSAKVFAWLATAAVWLAAASPLLAVDEPAAAQQARREILVPLDHAAPESGTIGLQIEIARPFDPAKPTVLIVQDAQQFFLLNEGWVARFEKDTFGEGFNLVGVIGRSFSPGIAAHLRRQDGSVDWVKAFRLLSSRQWIEDIDRVRRDLVGPEGRVLLYGVSGGGFLVHEYLAMHGERVTRAVTEAAPVRPIDAWLRLNHDRFWSELQGDPKRARALSQALAARPDRAELIQVLQRQHFFVKTEELAAERRKVIDEIIAGDEKALGRRKEEYQVNAVQQLLAKDVGIGIRVRMYEFCRPVLRHVRLDGEGIFPNLENEAILAGPLLDLQRSGAIPEPPFDRQALRRVPAEVLLIAGRHDQTADYRAQIALASLYPRGEIFLADDNHVSMRLAESGSRQRLIVTFLRHGLASPEMQALFRELDSFRWVER